MTPLNYLSQGPESENLRELQHWHLEEQQKHRTIEACSETKAKMTELEQELLNIGGLNELKQQLRKWAKGMPRDEKRRALGLTVAAWKVSHMAFLGNAGTGKTMVARLLGKLLHMVGILPTDKVTEVQRTDLVGEFVGQTGPKTRRKIKEAAGGIVFPMKCVISSNEGFCRRVTKFFYFRDFSSEVLAQILHLKMKNQAEESPLYEVIERGTTVKQRQEMNGGLVDPMLVNARENLDLRLDFDCSDTDGLLTITLEDLEAGLKSLSQ
uniref:ATPase AAA-type core domain-containing protein n=1 Tax=Nelumbo nucifera TaxID=4432 RepID=A0A822ZMH7_NELNU|nr:TPA_asm: hypothetical protein HUJ06_002905 [Nelumbo nucifera]